MMISADIRLKGLFSCSLCGKEALGETEVYNFTGHSRRDITDEISDIKPKKFPIGWASFPDRLVCPTCLVKD